MRQASAVLILALFGCLSPPIPQELVDATPPPAPEPMKLNDVVRLSDAGLSDEVIVGLLRSRGVGEQLSLSEVLVLGQRGVSSAVQLALVTAPPALARTPASRIIYRELFIPLWPVYGGGRWRLGCRIGIFHRTEEERSPAVPEKPQPPVPQPESIDP